MHVCKLTLIFAACVFAAATSHAIDKAHDYIKPSYKIELLRREYLHSLYELFKKDSIISKEFPGAFRMNGIAYGQLEIQIHRIVSAKAQARVEEIIKSTIGTTFLLGGTIEFYRDRIDTSSPGYSGRKFVSLLKAVSFSAKSKKTEQDAAANP